MSLFTDPVLFNYFIMMLYTAAIIRWSLEQDWGEALYWVNAFGLTMTVTFLYDDPSIGGSAAELSMNQVLTVLSVPTFAGLFMLSKKAMSWIRTTRIYSFIVDPALFNYLILISYASAFIRWTLSGSIPNMSYWFFAFGITAVVTFTGILKAKKTTGS